MGHRPEPDKRDRRDSRGVGCLNGDRSSIRGGRRGRADRGPGALEKVGRRVDLRVDLVRGLIYTIEPSTARDQLGPRSEEHTSELQSHSDLVCRLLLEKKKNKKQ